MQMTSSGVVGHTVSQSSFITSANSILAKFIKSPAAVLSQPATATLPSAGKVSHLGATNGAAAGYRFGIPVFEPISSESVVWQGRSVQPHAALADTSPATSGYPYWTHGNVGGLSRYAPLPSLLDYHYQSPAWTSAHFGNYMTDNFSPHRILSFSSPQPPHWQPSGLAALPSYQFPVFLASPSTSTPTLTATKSTSTNTAPSGLYIIGKTKNFFIPPVDNKVNTGQLPLSLIALHNTGPEEMLAISDGRRYGTHHVPSEYSNHYLGGQKAFFHQTLDHQQSSANPLAETRTLEHFQSPGGAKLHKQNVFYSPPTQLPSPLFDQYPWYMEDPLDNLSSLLERKPQKIYRSSVNWPSKSKYEPVNVQPRNDTSAFSLLDTKTYILSKVTTNRTTTKRPDFSFPLRLQDDAKFKPLLHGESQSDYFESLRRRSGFLNSSNNRPNGKRAPSQDSLMAANSVNRQTKMKMNAVEDDSKYGDDNENEDSGSAYDQSKSGEKESNIDSNHEDHSETASDDSGDSDDSGEGKNHDKERMQYLKDKGYAKHGWKNVYHKEEYGEAKRYHDIYR